MTNMKTKTKSKSDESDPHYLLNKVMAEKNISFDKVRETLLKEEYNGAGKFESE